MCNRWTWRCKWPWEIKNVTSPVPAGQGGGVHKSHHCVVCVSLREGPFAVGAGASPETLSTFGIGQIHGRKLQQRSSTLWLWCELHLRESPAPPTQQDHPREYQPTCRSLVILRDGMLGSSPGQQSWFSLHKCRVKMFFVSEINTSISEPRVLIWFLFLPRRAWRKMDETDEAVGSESKQL